MQQCKAKQNKTRPELINILRDLITVVICRADWHPWAIQAEWKREVLRPVTMPIRPAGYAYLPLRPEKCRCDWRVLLIILSKCFGLWLCLWPLPSLIESTATVGQNDADHYRSIDSVSKHKKSGSFMKSDMKTVIGPITI
jgi:hypothetical protein